MSFVAWPMSVLWMESVPRLAPLMTSVGCNLSPHFNWSPFPSRLDKMSAIISKESLWISAKLILCFSRKWRKLGVCDAVMTYYDVSVSYEKNLVTLVGGTRLWSERGRSLDSPSGSTDRGSCIQIFFHRLWVTDHHLCHFVSFSCLWIFDLDTCHF